MLRVDVVAQLRASWLDCQFCEKSCWKNEGKFSTCKLEFRDTCRVEGRLCCCSSLVLLRVVEEEAEEVEVERVEGITKMR